VEHETGWRRAVRAIHTERKGIIKIEGPAGPFSIEAKADRIDETADGAAIIDYKSGGHFSLKGIANGQYPQLSVEALILADGGFKEIGTRKVASLAYWILTGGADAGNVTDIAPPKFNIEDVIAKTREGLQNLIAAFDDEKTPYYSLPRSANAPRFNEYEHLARVKEWTALGDSDSEAA